VLSFFKDQVTDFLHYQRVRPASTPHKDDPLFLNLLEGGLLFPSRSGTLFCP
jgi:hypothetical protein